MLITSKFEGNSSGGMCVISSRIKVCDQRITFVGTDITSVPLSFSISE
jgi:hypothetical protein